MFAAVGFGGFGQGGVIFLLSLVGNVAFEPADGYRVTGVADGTDVLAAVGTDASAAGREGVGLVHQGESAGDVVFTDAADVAWDVHMCGTGGHAESAVHAA